MTLRLSPDEEAAVFPRVPRPDAVHMSEMAVRPPCIAVVDDEPSVRKALDRLLRSAGFSVRSFDSGSAFIASLNDFEPCCVVLDLHMPPPNGFEVLQILRDGGKCFAIVVISAEHSGPNCARALTCGASSFLTKPIDDALLLDAVQAAMRPRERPR